jgi:hypothetical protein
MFKVINGTKPLNKHDLYYNAYLRLLENYRNNQQQDIKPIMKKFIYLGTKVVIHKEKHKSLSKELLEYDFTFVNLIKSMMSNLTPNEFINIFPITKDYDGNRWQSKDYFYTMDYIRQMNSNEPIGEKINEFLWEYHNWNISMFVVNMMSIASDLRRLDTGKGIMEEFCDENNIKTYTLHTNNQGKQFLIDNETGKKTKVKRSAKHLKVIKGS